MGAFDGLAGLIATTIADQGLGTTVSYQRSNIVDDEDTGYTLDLGGPPVDVTAIVGAYRRSVSQGDQSFNIVARVTIAAEHIDFEPAAGDSLTHTLRTDVSRGLTVRIVEPVIAGTAVVIYKLLCEAA